MSKWISKAANVFKKDAPPAAQPFEVLCQCQQSHMGVRRQRHQHLVCKVCGTSLFVLPRDPYPQPVPKKEKPGGKRPPVEPEESQPRRAAPKVKQAVPQEVSSPAIDLDDSDLEIDLTPLPGKRKRTRPVSKERNVAAASGRKKQKPRSSESEPPAEPFLVRARRVWTPFRLVVLAVCLVLGFTGWWMVRQAGLQAAMQTVKVQGERGLEQIRGGDWIAAYPDLEAAALALDRLGRTDPEAETLRQYFREANALMHRSSVTLPELITEARQDYEKRDEEDEDRSRHLARRYQGEWFVIEGNVQPLSSDSEDDEGDEADEPTRFGMRLPWSPDPQAKSMEIVADFPVFHRLQKSQVTSQPFLFAGEIAECSWNADKKIWVIQLNSETGFLWTHEKTYAALGFDGPAPAEDESRQAMLASQSEMMGVKP